MIKGGERADQQSKQGGKDKKGRATTRQGGKSKTSAESNWKTF